MNKLLPAALALLGLFAYQATNIATSGTLPANCSVGNVYVKTGASAGFYICLATDAWTGPLAAGGSGDVTSSATITDHAIVRGDGGAKGVQESLITISDAGALAFPDNVRQTFNPGANASGFNVGSIAGDPDTPSNADIWYDSTANELTARINGANVALGAGGSGAVGDMLDFQFARKTAATSATSDIVLDDDPHLTIAVGASETWIVEFDLVLAATGVTGDLRVTVSVPTSPTSCAQQMIGLSPSAASPNGDAAIFSNADCTDTGIGAFGTDDGFAVTMRLVVTLVNGSNAGNVTLRWAQNVSNGTATTLAINSIARATRVQTP